MASSLSRSQSNKAPLGADGTDSHHTCTASKSAVTAWSHHIHMDQKFWGMFPASYWIYGTQKNEAVLKAKGGPTQCYTGTQSLHALVFCVSSQSAWMCNLVWSVHNFLITENSTEGCYLKTDTSFAFKCNDIYSVCVRWRLKNKKEKHIFPFKLMEQFPKLEILCKHC